MRFSVQVCANYTQSETRGCKVSSSNCLAKRCLRMYGQDSGKQPALQRLEPAWRRPLLSVAEQNLAKVKECQDAPTVSGQLRFSEDGCLDSSCVSYCLQEMSRLFFGLVPIHA